MNAIFLLSPTSLNYIPVLILHLVSLGYLLIKGPNTRQAWLFCGWLSGMTLATASQCAAGMLYSPLISAYLGWWGGVVGVTLAILSLLQFAYYFPRLRYPREARFVLWASIAVTGLLFLWMVWETVTRRPNLLFATSTADADGALTAQVTWVLYDFERFIFGFVHPGDSSPFVSFKFFDLWQILGNVWVLTVWLRKTVQFSKAPDSIPFCRRVLQALHYPEGQEAQRSRAWVFLMLLAPLPVLASSLEGGSALPAGTFAIVHLLVLFAIVITYVNYAPEPTTFMVKLVGISLVTLLVILGLISNYAMRAYRAAYVETLRAELRHIQTLLQEERFETLPPDVLYVAARPISGLFTSEYSMVTARPGAPDATDLAGSDALLREGLAHHYYPTRFAVLHENPWLGLTGVIALEGEGRQVDALRVPEEAMSYRGVSSPPGEHILYTTFSYAGTRYEVGYSYLDYRRILHRAALPLAMLFLGTTAVILVVFPRFFRRNLVAPLARLLAGVDQVNRGQLDVQVPVLMEDEIGRLTRAFNQMVASLKASEESLHALNLSLEQRVVDRTRDLATLYEVASLVSHPASLRQLLSAVLARVVDGTDAAAGIVLVNDVDRSRLRPVATYQIAPHISSWINSLPVLDTMTSQSEPLLIHDLASNPYLASLFAATAPREVSFPYRTMVSVPIQGQEGILGLLVIFGADSFLFNVEDLEVLSSVAEQLSVAIENMRLRQRATKAVVWEERQRLARDLHDSVTQLLYSQVLFANAAGKALDAQQLEQTSHYLTRLSESAARALREMRLMLYRLRPSRLAEAGLVGALQRRLETVEQRAGIQVHFACEAAPDLPSAVEEALYHIAEEALNNALKHAAASQVTVELTYPPERVCLSVTDDGRGFDVISVSQGLGLQSLRERTEALGGKVTVTSALGEGTCVVACLSLTPTRRKLDE